MKINTEQIINNSNTMFSIISSALQKNNDFNQKATEISIKEKITSNKNDSLGKVIDMYI